MGGGGGGGGGGGQDNPAGGEKNKPAGISSPPPYPGGARYPETGCPQGASCPGGQDKLLHRYIVRKQKQKSDFLKLNVKNKAHHNNIQKIKLKIRKSRSKRPCTMQSGLLAHLRTYPLLEK